MRRTQLLDSKELRKAGKEPRPIDSFIVCLMMALAATKLPSATAMTTTPQSGACTLDVVFVLDRSQMVTEKNFPFVKDFAKNVVKEMVRRIPPHSVNATNGLQFAVVAFNTHAKVMCYFNQSVSEQAVLDCITNTNYFPGLTNTAEALNVTLNQVLQESSGDRPDDPNVVILITDGAHTKGTADPAGVARKIREQVQLNRNTAILAVGVTWLNGDKKGVFEDELKNITGCIAFLPYCPYIFSVSYYQNLTAYTEMVINTFKCTPKCNADIAFIIETTQLIAKIGFMKEKAAMYRIIDNLYATNPKKFSWEKDFYNYYGLAYFSSPPTEPIVGSVPKSSIVFDPYPWSRTEIHSMTDSLTWGIKGVTGGRCDLELGVSFADKMFVKASALGRYREPTNRIVILMAQGFWNTDHAPFQEARYLRDHWNASIYAIGMNPRINVANLLLIIGGTRPMDRYFTMDNYTLIAARINEALTRAQCKPLSLVL